jgi:hypothetical protein
MERIGVNLRKVRQQWRLSLREVEQRSLRFAEEWGDRSYQISASWLDRLEREEHELTVNKLMVLASIYNVCPEQLLGFAQPGIAQSISLKQPFKPQETILTGDPMEEPPDAPGPHPLPDKTTLLSTETASLLVPYRRGIIGKCDLTLGPMIRPGSIIKIDTRNRAISSRKDWIHEFQRPIYFLLTGEGYVCAWCELDKESEWLTVIPHPLSPASSRRWRYKKEIENIGRVVAVAIRVSEFEFVEFRGHP